ncbi:chalcone isomerase family protein [Spirabiliibacterium pneumoniae]|uniref:chalcone isomerase family protein n=1 Tax=Spirabiliibacterium pneumoniae TaxID=221400 RepID=UPI001F486045|nr:chalcone isomerase family protein [Spirabiliibacterium pneumoniae]
MKWFKLLLFCALLGVAQSALAQWIPLGTVDYKWGPFHIYTITLFSEDGQYKTGQRPLMLTLKYAKQVEGKNFAITLKKELDDIAPDVPKETRDQWFTQLEKALPDFHPEDSLSYIALEDTGYFVLNDTVLEPQFSPEFNQAFLDIWLSDNSSFKRMQDKLLGKDKAQNEVKEEPQSTQPEPEPVRSDVKDPDNTEQPSNTQQEVTKSAV